MKTSFRYPLVCAALFAAATLTTSLTSCCSEKEEAENNNGQPLRRVETQHMTANAQVTAVNLDTREVTLRGSDGNEFTIVAGDDVKRLDEVRVGDTVRVDYVIAVVAELREATPDEAANPLTVTDVTGRAPNNMPPSGGAVRQYRIVTTVQSIDTANQTVTVQGPHGQTLTARAANPDNLARIHVGDTIVITYTEGVALSLVRMNQQ